jgi:hypothetical protein
MLKLENINKLIGHKLYDWGCTDVVDESDKYTIRFRSSSYRAYEIEFHLIKQDDIAKGLYQLYGELYESSSFSRVCIETTSNNVTRGELQSKTDFLIVLKTPIRIFEKDIEVRMTRKAFNTASLSSNKFVSRGMYGSPFGKTIPTPPPISWHGIIKAPNWYVSESKIKKPTMWETFKEMVNWDKWVGILFPIKQSYDTVKELYEEKKPKKIKAKKAAF